MIDKNASLSSLKATLPPKIEMALFLLDFITQNKPTKPKFGDRTLASQGDGYMLSTWFSNLWFIAKERYLFMTEFIQLF